MRSRAAALVLGANQHQPAGHGAMRRHNLALVLNRLVGEPSLSRADIATSTGLTRSTTSSLVGDLIDWGLLREVDPSASADDGSDPSGRVQERPTQFAEQRRPGGVHGSPVEIRPRRRTGRPATLLELDGSQLAAIGLEVNVGAVTTTVMDVGGRVLAERRHAVDNEQRPVEEAIEVVLAEIEAAQKVLPPGASIVGIGLAVAGLVQEATGMVHAAPNLGWHNAQLGERLQHELGTAFGNIPMVVDNEANFGALAEHVAGGAIGVDNFVYLLAERGVGGGVVAGGQLLRGADGYAGEIGHISVLPGGDVCSCGSRGCWETLIGLTAMLRSGTPDVADRVLADPATSPEEKIGVIVARARDGDATALAALAEAGHWLGVGIGILVDVLNPQLVVIAGALAEIAEWIVDPAMSTLVGETVSDDGGRCVVTTSSLGHRAPSLGAALRCVQRVRDDPTLARR